eukprot:PLAT10602.1.p1 GENE.PLAT10602.1~~PLAT10602.1.p1  ORF type:complete len:305 (-),score=89.58 PLAT10602.1:211-1125(-)
MCYKKQLQFVMNFLNGADLIIALTTLLNGTTLLTSPDPLLAYNPTEVLVAGSLLVVAAVLLMIASMFGFWGSQSHNKALLALFITIGTVSCITQVASATRLRDAIEPPMPWEDQFDCLRFEPAKSLDCSILFESQQYESLYFIWLTYHRVAAVDAERKLALSEAQDDGRCCGFARPGFCRDRGQWTVPWIVEANQGIGYEATPCASNATTGINFYRRSLFCDRALCPYDEPVTPCSERALSAGTRGCAAQWGEQIDRTVRTVADTALGLIVLPVLAMLLSFMLCMKKNVRDVLPESALELEALA